MVTKEFDGSLVIVLNGHLRTVGQDDVDGAERFSIGDWLHIADVAFDDVPACAEFDGRLG